VSDGIQFIIQQKLPPRKSGTHKGKTFWQAKAFCCGLDAAIHWLITRKVYGVPGTYGVEALDMLGKVLDEVKALAKKTIKEMERVQSSPA